MDRRASARGVSLGERDENDMRHAAARDQVLLTHIPTLDAVLGKHAAILGRDFEAYRNHAYRVANLCAAQSSGSPEQIEKIAIVAAFHDLGIRTDRTFDYLSPSASLARAHLTHSGQAVWIPEITAAWMDISMGLITFGLSRTLFEAVVAKWPRAGFHNLRASDESARHVTLFDR
jgi:hypothetical protein